MSTEKILIIDDNEDHQNVVQHILKKENYDVLKASTGNDGLLLLEEYDDIRVIIVDLIIPDIPGIEILERIKDRPHPLRRIVLTAHDDELTHSIAEELKVFTYLSKPISKQTLLFSVKSAISDLTQMQLKSELHEAKKWVELGQVTTEFVHFVGNKVGIIPNYIEFIREELTNVPEKVKEKLDSMNNIVGQIIDLKRELLSPFTNQKVEKINLQLEMENILENLENLNDIKLNKCFESVPSIMFNGNDFKKIMGNLFSNAIDSMQDSSKKELTISIHLTEEDTTRIVISDTGCGISDENREKIFLPFYTTKNGTNFGIGLFSVKNILAKYESTINFQNNENGGVSFFIDLPKQGTTILEI